MRKENSLILTGWMAILLISFFVHGSPSEAYFPALFVPIVLAWGIFLTKIKKKSNLLRFLVIFLALALAVYQVRFLLGNRMMTYGLGLNQRMKVASFIIKDVGEENYQIFGRGPGAEFASFLDNYRYLLWFKGKPPTEKENDLVYILIEDKKTSELVKKEIKEKEIFSLEGVLMIKEKK